MAWPPPLAAIHRQTKMARVNNSVPVCLAASLKYSTVSFSEYSIIQESYMDIAFQERYDHTKLKSNKHL